MYEFSAPDAGNGLGGRAGAGGNAGRETVGALVSGLVFPHDLATAPKMKMQKNKKANPKANRTTPINKAIIVSKRLARAPLR